MDETYIIIEEDNERKILLEGQEIKDAHREAEERYRHLTEPPAGRPDLEAIRQAFLCRNRPEAGGEEAPSPEIAAEEPKTQPPEPSPEAPEPEEPEMPPEQTEPEEPEEPEKNDGPRDVPYTVLDESEVEVLNSAGEEKNTPGGKPAGSPRLSPAVLAAAGVFLLCILWIYIIWR
ncbi:MAG: hypothetical protein IKT15_02460 [Firmicutes bacterium]|nr:hypothetical protein [Bacillota bacterium]